MNRVEVHGKAPSFGTTSPAEIFREQQLLTAAAAREAALTAVRAGAPGGFAGDEMTGRVTRGAEVSITIAPRPKARHKALWVTKGTGVFGPSHRPIRRRKIDKRTGKPLPFAMPGGGFAQEIQGQHPNPFIERARPIATAAVQRVFVAGGARAQARVAAVLARPVHAQKSR